MKKRLLSTLLTFFCLGVLAQPYTITGNVYNDPDGGTIDSSANSFSLPIESLNVVLVSFPAQTIARAVPVNSNGTFTITAVPSGTYYAMVVTPNENLMVGNPAPVAILETGWTRTGETLFAAGTPDGTIDGKTLNFTVNSNVSNVKFGIQERAFSYNKMNNLLNRTAATPVALSVNMSSAFTNHGPTSNTLLLTGHDNGGGNIMHFTINALPKYGTLYLGAVPVTTLAAVATLTPAQIATLAYLPNTLALAQEQDYFTYYVTDNALSKSNNATYVIPFALMDSDGDGVANRNDLDSDNDGITDEAECALNNIGNLQVAYGSNQFSFINPSDFGFTIGKRTGIDTTVDISAKFGYAPNTGAVIVRITNGNTHPSANVFYTNDSTGATQWSITGTIGCYAVLTHGLSYYSYDTRTITLLNGTPKNVPFAQAPFQTSLPNWTSGNDGYSWWLRNSNPVSNPPDSGRLVIGLPHPEPKYFQFASTANNRQEWSTYFVEVLPECDYDMDGTPNRLDADSDNDGCLDAVEGGGAFNYGSVDTSGKLTGTVAANGTPTAAGTGQTVGSSQNAAIFDPACFVNITGSVFKDANGNTIINSGETFTALPVPLYVYLVDNNGIIVDSAHVAANGTYTLNARPNQTYTIELSTIQYAIGTNTTTTPISNTPPSGYVNTGENGTNNTGIGDGLADGVLTVVAGVSNINNQNFGIQQPPTADPKAYTVTETAFSTTPPIGYPTEAGYKSIPMSSSALTGITAGSLSGTDAEDCASTSSCTSGTGSTFSIHTINANTKLYYDFGAGPVLIDVTGGPVTIPNFDATKLVVYGAAGAGLSGNPLGFTYSITDKAGAQSLPVNYSITTTTPLPVTSLYFTATKANTMSLLQWHTTTEQNNKGFEVEKSANSLDWSEIGFVTTLAENGKSNTKLTYTYTDKAPLKGTNFYRLKQVDVDGRFVYSEVRKVTFGTNSDINIMPNPTNGRVSVVGLSKGKNQIQLVNAIGQVVISTETQNETEYNVDLSSFAAGAYYISIRNEDGSLSKHRVIKR